MITDYLERIGALRFVAPTHIGDTPHVETEVLTIEDRNPGDGVVTSRFVVCNQHGDHVLVASLKTLVVRSDAP